MGKGRIGVEKWPKRRRRKGKGRSTKKKEEGKERD